MLESFTDTSAPGHFGPKTLRHLYLVPKCPGHFDTGAEVSEDTSAPDMFIYIISEDTSAPVPKCLKTLREGAAGQQQANRTQTCLCGPTCSGPCPAASPHYASCAAFVGRRHKWYYCRWLSRCMVLSRLDYGYATLAGLPGNQIDRLVCDERRCTTCLLCAEA